MRNLKNHLFITSIFLFALVFALQAPVIFSLVNYPATNGFVQPGCPGFNGWNQNPAQYQRDNENEHGLGLIPAPVDLSPMPYMDAFSLRQAKLMVRKSQNRLMSVFNNNTLFRPSFRLQGNNYRHH
jgi:hypothetical protein